MKIFVISLIILAVIVLGGFIYAYALDAITTSFTNDTDKIDEALLADDFDGAIQDFLVFKQKWKSSRKILTALVDHASLSAVDVGIADLEQNLYHLDSKDSMVSSSILKELLKNVSSNEQFSLENIF